MPRTGMIVNAAHQMAASSSENLTASSVSSITDSINPKSGPKFSGHQPETFFEHAEDSLASGELQALFETFFAAFFAAFLAAFLL